MSLKKMSPELALITVAAIALLVLRIPGAIASPAKSAEPAGPNEHDEQLKSFLRKRFRVPNAGDIELGAPKPAPIPGLWTRQVTIVNEQGQKATAELFTDASGTKVIIGRFLDVNSDPWERVNVKTLHLDDRATLGPANAPVTVIEFADFECPYCARAFSEVETMVNTTYKGRVRVVFKNFPLNIHQWAMQAAIAAECVRRQNPEAFWNFARNLYSNQNAINPENLRQRIDTFASGLDLDSQALDACIMGKPAEQQVQQDMSDGASIHINSTPTFLINGVPVVGVLPTSKVFDFVIQEELRQSHASR
jgi:protein-disulfide isomerase